MELLLFIVANEDIRNLSETMVHANGYSGDSITEKHSNYGNEFVRFPDRDFIEGKSNSKKSDKTYSHR